MFAHLGSMANGHVVPSSCCRSEYICMAPNVDPCSPYRLVIFLTLLRYYPARKSVKPVSELFLGFFFGGLTTAATSSGLHWTALAIRP
jgi:hypothetical protein